MLLEEHECRDRVRAQTDETGNPALEDPAQTFLGGDLRDECNDALLRVGAHDSSLDDIDGGADGGGDEASHDGRGEVGGQVVAEVGALQEFFLENVVAGQLRGGHENGADAVGPHAAEEAAHAFVFDHARETVDGVLVVSALLGREGGVVLHADVEDVGGVACDAAQETGGGGHGDQCG